MRAAAYLRVSTDGQVGEDKYGLAAQRQAIVEFAEANDYKIVQWYSDEGFSGATLDRPGLQSFLSDATHSQFDTLLVARTDRIARDLFIQLWVEKELSKSDVQIISAGEPFHGSDPMTVAFRQMAGVFAELEKHRIRERMSAGRKQKARQGGYAGGGAPMGYSNVRGAKALQIDDGKADTVRRIFELRDDNPKWKLDYIADALNSEGHTTVNGKTFTRVQVWRVLKREEFYRGTYFYAGVEAPGRHTPILESEII